MINCIFILKSIVDCSINSRKKLYCMFIDFRKAFDLVYRNGICLKQLDMGISNKFINTIKKMFESVKVCMRSMNTLSDFFDSHVGVKQGEPLSPLLFIIFINNMASDIAHTSISAETITQIQIFMLLFVPGRVAKSVGHLTRKSGVLGSIPGLATYFRFSFRFFKRAVVSYWRKYVHEVLVNRLGGLRLPRKSVVRLTDRPETTIQQ